MAGAGEVLEKARELYDSMGERTRKLAQAAAAAEQNYQGLTEKTHGAASAVERLEEVARGAQREIKSAVSQLFWLILVTTFASAALAALFVRFLTQ